ncbi:hypothetical protein TrRE_jg2372 [Triparma retinervis]|uniref:Serine/threonine-protein phosphatase T n=1 Tax=Triparma retinervis TaxID=2557542 RepID=A0A9W7DQ86_9STRA|nr:hypothetical protein TrRE_jg2372 [Triparma retinervis]
MAAIETPEEKALRLKNSGNEALKICKYSEAADLYTQALELHETSVLFSNRAMSYIKMEQYGQAILDADCSIKIDPQYVKAYYRRGSANFALGKNKAAKKDFKKVCQMKPKDRDARAKLAACTKAVNEAAFAMAIESDETAPLSQTLDPGQWAISAAYEGPHPGAGGVVLEDMDAEKMLFTPGMLPREFVMDAIQGFKDGKHIHKRYVARLLISCKEYFEGVSTLTEITVPDLGSDGTPETAHVTVCGDTHGQFYDVLNIFELNGYPSASNPYLFNGDYVDRGSWGLEVVLTYFLLKISDPNCIFLTRGNHETKNMNKIYGFEGEVKHKYDINIFNLFLEVFCWLPLAATINNKVFVVHGGLSSEDSVTLSDIKALKRGIEPPEGGLFSDLLWSDPQPFPGKSPSKRGVGYSFGPDITAAFLDKNGLDLLVRSHEVKDEGYLVEHAGKCITIFSAPNYCDSMGNKGAFIHFGHDLEPKFTQYAHSPHPDVRPMAYAQGMGGLMGL